VSLSPAPAWTGGQYSVYRVGLALAVVSLLLDGSGRVDPLFIEGTRVVLGLGAGLALAAGWRDRWACALLASGLLLEIGLVARGGGDGDLEGLAFRATLALLLLALHGATPPHPFGSWEARARPDPGGGWRLPPAIWQIAWLALGLVHGLAVAGLLPSAALLATPPASETASGTIALLGGILHVGIVVAALLPPLRRGAWSSIFLWQALWSVVLVGDAVAPSLWLLTLLAFDPGWIPARSRRSRRTHASTEPPPPDAARLFYDGDCGFCHRSVRFVLAEEPASPSDGRLRFAPLASDAFEALIERHPSLGRDLPDSIVLELEDGTILTRSEAVLEIGSRLGGLWRALSILGGLLPRRLLDAAYDGIARIRKRLFAQPKEVCPILPPRLRQRFDL